LASGPLWTVVENRKSLTPTRVQTIRNRPAHSRPYMTYGMAEFFRPSGSMNSLSHREKFDERFENFIVVIFSLFFILRICKKRNKLAKVFVLDDTYSGKWVNITGRYEFNGDIAE